MPPTTPIQEWLDSYCLDAVGVAGGVVILAESENGEPTVVACSEEEVALPQALRMAAGEAIRTQAPVIHASGGPTADGKRSPDGEQSPDIVSLPVRTGERAVGAIALELRDAQSATYQSVLAQLERAADAIANAIAVTADKPTSLEAGKVLQFQATVLSHERFKEAATAFATELASDCKLDHVAIGFRDGKYSRVEAVSDFADFEVKTKIFRMISIAMDEAIEQGAVIAYPGTPQDRPRINVAQVELAKRRGCVVCTVPLVVGAEIIGAATLERNGNVPMRTEEIADYEQIMCMVGPILALKRENERPWYARLKQTLARIRTQLLGPQHLFTKGAALAGLVALVAAFLVPVDYRIGAPARLEGSIQRALVAPADGFLKHAYVRPGDLVQTGQVLVELAQDDLELERRKWESELAQHENAAPAALARNDRGEFVISMALADEARAKLGLVEEQIMRSRVRAPFDGLVIMGDLSQLLGAPVRRGDTLVTIAPANEFRLILEVDERDIANIEIGQRGHLALGALPRQKFSFQVQRITPVAEARDGRNFFEVEGKLDESLVSMRPGLQGVAKIAIDQRPMVWILAHRILDWARVAAWSMGI